MRNNIGNIIVFAKTHFTYLWRRMMATTTKIEWTESTWNPVTGCTKISSGCKNCYAARMAKRLKAMGNARYQNEFQVTLHDDLIERPLKWKKSKTIFVNSMSDLFHEDIPTDFIKRVFDTMNEASWHTFQVLTKRSERLKELSDELIWTDNIWMGVTVENDTEKYRIQDLLQTEAQIKYISFEPLISKINIDSLKGIDWAIVGGESGPGSRPIDPLWVDDIHSLCIQDDIPFFFKQWGGTNKKKAGRLFHGKEWSEYPLK